MMKRFLIAALMLVVGGTAWAQRPPGQTDTYTEINPPMATDSPGKVEVVEFFWYGCPHCYDLEPQLNAWIKKLPKDVEFKRVPAMFNEQWGIAGRVYYTLEAMGELERLHQPLYDAIHKGGLRITNEPMLVEWLGKQNVDVEKFKAAWKSFAVEGKMKRAMQLTATSKIDGTPAIVVNGRYLISASASSSREKMLALADVAINQSRKEIAAAATKK